MTTSSTLIPVAVAVLTNCMDCGKKLVINDRDPHDSFNDDDMAVVCTATPNPKRDLKSIYIADHSEFRATTVACRPYNLRKESDVPTWCPQKVQAQPAA